MEFSYSVKPRVGGLFNAFEITTQAVLIAARRPLLAACPDGLAELRGELGEPGGIFAVLALLGVFVPELVGSAAVSAVLWARGELQRAFAHGAVLRELAFL